MVDMAVYELSAACEIGSVYSLAHDVEHGQSSCPRVATLPMPRVCGVTRLMYVLRSPGTVGRGNVKHKRATPPPLAGSFA